MKVLHIDSSIFGDASVSRQLSQAIVTQLTAKHSDASVEYLDLATQMIPHLTAEILITERPILPFSNFIPPSGAKGLAKYCQ